MSILAGGVDMGGRRRLWLGALAGVVCATSAHAQPAGPVLTEGDIARLVSEHPQFAAAAAARRVAAEARARAAGAPSNPEIEVVREGGDGFGGTGTEDSARLRYPLDLGGVRAAERRAGLARRDAELVGVESAAARRVAEARRLYHEAIGLRRGAAARQVLADRLALLETMVRRREAEGDASQLDLRRIMADTAAARTAAMRLQAEGAAKWTELLGRLGPAGAGYAPPERAAAPSLAPLDSYLALAAETPEGRRLAAEARAAELDALAARRRARTPQTALVAGLRSVDDPMGRSTGLIAGASVSIPLSRGPRAEAEARAAEASALRAEHAAAVEMQRSAVLAVYGLAQRLSLNAASVQDTAGLLAPAEAAFEAGELELNELLATHRTAAEAALAQIDLEQEAALARVRLDELAGKTNP